MIHMGSKSREGAGSVIICLSAELNVGGRITVRLVSILTLLDLTKQENIMLFVCAETTQCKPVKQETSCTVILPIYGQCSL